MGQRFLFYRKIYAAVSFPIEIRLVDHMEKHSSLDILDSVSTEGLFMWNSGALRNQHA